MYVLAEIDSGGYIYVQHKNDSYRTMYHRGNVVRIEDTYPKLVSCQEAWREAGGADSDRIIMAVGENLVATALWFSASQHERNMPADRLWQWKGCYGNLEVKRMED